MLSCSKKLCIRWRFAYSLSYKIRSKFCMNACVCDCSMFLGRIAFLARCGLCTAADGLVWSGLVTVSVLSVCNDRGPWKSG